MQLNNDTSAALAAAICSALEDSEIGPDIIGECANLLVEKISVALGQDIDFMQRTLGAVDEILFPSSDADGEYLSDSDD